MRVPDDQKSFVEVRVYVMDRNRKASDLSLVRGSLLLVPQEGPALRRDFQRMTPDDPQGVPAGDPQSLPDGRQVRLSVVEFTKPFQTLPAAGAAYFKADVPAEAAAKVRSATTELHFPDGKQKLELRSLSGR